MLIVNSNEKQKTFKELYQKYYDSIFNYIFHNIMNSDAAEDIVSNTFFNALKFLQKNNQRIDNFHAWIYKIATNEIIQYKKKAAKKSHLSLEEGYVELEKISLDDNDKNIEQYDDFIALHNELNKIKPIEKSLITLHFFEDKTYPEISEILNINENTLRPMMSRILKKLNKKLKNKINFFAPIFIIFYLIYRGIK